MQVTKKVMVSIEKSELIELFIEAMYPKAMAPKGKEHTLFRALAVLVGRSDVEAVKKANKWASYHDYPRVKVAEFRRWLPTVLSELFAEWWSEKS